MNKLLNRQNEKSEHDIQSLIRLELTKLGIPCFRINVGKVKMKDGRWFSTGAPKGFPDLFGFRPDGRIFFIEVKNEVGKLRPEQKIFIEQMRKRGALAGVARSVEEAMEIVNG